MNKIVGAVAAIAILVAAGTAAAADANGKISKVDSKSITLSNGMNFTLSKGLSAKDLKAGDEVKVTYEQKGGQRVATDIEPAKMAK